MKLDFGSDWKELRRFDKLKTEERSIVFYAENKASMNHFRGLIESLTEKENLQICYVTSVRNDPMLVMKNDKIKTFYIGDGTARTKFFIFLKAKILVMDMPNLDTFHIKRSKVYPVHYIYIFHSMFSIHSYLRKGAVDNYDTVFCVGEHHKREILETEKVYGLKSKQLIEYGFGRLDTLLEEKKSFVRDRNNDENLIIITPTYGEKNLLEICGVKLIDVLLKANFKILLRPHFRIFQESPEIIKEIYEKFQDNENFILEEGVIKSKDFHSSKCMISDWSGISFEYAFTFERPVVYIDVPKKEMNEESSKISTTPIEISLRHKIGIVVNPKDLESIPKMIQNMDDETKEDIRKIRSETVYNIGKSAKIGVEYIEKILDS